MAGATAQELAIRTAVETVAAEGTLLQKVDSPGRLYTPITKAQMIIDMNLVIGTDVQAHSDILDALADSGAVDTFLDLSDTPNSYSSDDIGKILRLKDDLTGLEFTNEYQAAGNGTEILFNDGGIVGASDKLTFDKETGIVSHVGNLYLKTQSSLYLWDADDTHYVRLSAPSTVTSSIFYYWPPANGAAGAVLSTDGNSPATLSWVSGNTPGGSDKYIQYNEDGGFGGDSGLYWEYEAEPTILHVSGIIKIHPHSEAVGELRFHDLESSDYVGFKAPATLGVTLVWALPTADGPANEVWGTDGSGNLIWRTHDELAGFVANEHINHASVTLTAGTGLTGGGTIAANRTFALDIPGLVADASPDGAADYVVTYDADGETHKKVLINNLPGSGGAGTFLDLTDTPNSYDSADIGKYPRVKDDLSGLEFVEGATGAHTIASHSDTTATGAELEELTDGSQTTLHSHAGAGANFTDLGDVDEASIDSTDIGKIVQVGNDLKLEFTDSPVFDDVQLDGHGYFGSEVDNGNSGAADTIDWTIGNKQKSTLTDDCTFTFTDPSGPCNLVLKLIHEVSGGALVTWPDTVKWVDGVPPILTNEIGAIDIICFYYDGTNYFGTAVLNFS